MSLSLGSLQAAAVGGLASLPLVGLKAYLWSDHGKRQIGWVEDWHRTQVGMWQRQRQGPAMHDRARRNGSLPAS